MNKLLLSKFNTIVRTKCLSFNVEILWYIFTYQNIIRPSFATRIVFEGLFKLKKIKEILWKSKKQKTKIQTCLCI